MSIVNVFVPESPADHAVHLKALAAGIPGAKIYPLEYGYEPCDVAVVFGVGKRSVPSSHARGAVIYEHHYRARKSFICIERGFVKRNEYYGVGLNGLNGHAEFGNKDCPPDRWEDLGVELKPYRDNDDGYNLVCGQVPWDASVQHTDHVAWCRAVVTFLNKYSKHETRFRPHPDAGGFDYGIEQTTGSFKEDIAGARCVVTFSSTTASLALLEGIPTFAYDAGSIASGVAANDLTEENLHELPKPAREQWAYNLAYAQWTADEMRRGLPWARLEKFL